MARAPFSFGAWRAVEAAPEDAPRVQRFCEANPAYFHQCEGRAPPPDAGREFVADRPPEGFSCREQFNLLLEAEGGGIDGLAAVAIDLLAPGVWHLGLLVAADRLHGSGFARDAHAAYERWARDGGARWLRLGVVDQNARARRFWARQGYAEVRTRDGVAMGTLVNTVRVLVKPLAGTLDDYLAQVPRDRCA